MGIGIPITNDRQSFDSLKRLRRTGIEIPIINLRRSDDRLRFIKAISIPFSRCLMEKRLSLHVTVWTRSSADTVITKSVRHKLNIRDHNSEDRKIIRRWKSTGPWYIMIKYGFYHCSLTRGKGRSPIKLHLCQQEWKICIQIRYKKWSERYHNTTFC